MPVKQEERECSAEAPQEGAGGLEAAYERARETDTKVVDLSRFDRTKFQHKRSIIWRVAWFFIGQPLLSCRLLPFSGFRTALLRIFGAKIGKGVIIHFGVTVKFPWNLVIGNHCWIGERVWIMNPKIVRLHNNVCISQGAFLCTGSHDWSDPTFGICQMPIHIRDGAWVAAKSMIMPGTVLMDGAIAAAGSVVQGTIPAFEIYGGNRAVFLAKRRMRAA
jgi:putative colanic acid biosynthesis acetyltransferase WcaF